MRVRSACLKCIKLQEAALSWAELLQRLKGFTQELKRLWPQEHAILAQECSFEHLRHVQSNAGISMELGLAHSDIKISSLGLSLWWCFHFVSIYHVGMLHYVGVRKASNAPGRETVVVDVGFCCCCCCYCSPSWSLVGFSIRMSMSISISISMSISTSTSISTSISNSKIIIISSSRRRRRRIRHFFSKSMDFTTFYRFLNWAVFP